MVSVIALDRFKNDVDRIYWHLMNQLEKHFTTLHFCKLLYIFISKTLDQFSKPLEQEFWMPIFGSVKLGRYYHSYDGN